jgi:transposase
MKGADSMPKLRFTEAQKQEIQQALKKSKNTYEYKRLQCLMLRAEKNMKLREISEIVGYNYKAVGNIISKYFKEGLNGILGEKRKGGNKRYLSVEEENSLLKPFFKRADQGKLLIVAEVHTAYEKKVGHTVPASTVYRMLSRHNWRKVVPRSKHPKSKPEEQEAYKKNQ